MSRYGIFLGLSMLKRFSLTSKVARRMFLLFFLGAVVPVVCITVYSDLYVQRNLEAQANRDLVEIDRMIRDSVHRRVSLLADYLNVLAAVVFDAPDFHTIVGSDGSEWSSVFDGLALRSKGASQSWGGDFTFPELGEADEHYLASGSILLKVSSTDSRVLLLVQKGASVLVARARRSVFEEIVEGNSLAWRAEVVIAAENDTVLASSLARSMLPAFRNITATTIEHRNTLFYQQINGDAYMGVTQPEYFHDDLGAPFWTVLVMRPKEDLYLPLLAFRQSFYPLIGATVLLVTLLGVIFIRRHGLHLNALLEATQQVARRDFDIHLEIRSKDEFERLGHAFNQMAEDLVLSETMLLQAHKMESIGQLSAGVIHEVSNPNSAIGLNIRLLKTVWEGVEPVLELSAAADPSLRISGMPFPRLKEKVRAILDETSESSASIVKIVNDLKSFVRQDPGQEKVPVNLSEVVSSALQLIHYQLRQSHAELLLEIPADLPLIRGHEQKLKQVIINLVQNACQALPSDGGAITIRAEELVDEAFVQIEVIDDGVGIPAEQLHAVTAPFMTTRQDAGGTGLGLSICVRIIQEHSGTLEYENRELGGVVARLRLPIYLGTSLHSPKSETD